MILRASSYDFTVVKLYEIVLHRTDLSREYCRGVMMVVMKAVRYEPRDSCTGGARWTRERVLPTLRRSINHFPPPYIHSHHSADIQALKSARSTKGIAGAEYRNAIRELAFFPRPWVSKSHFVDGHRQARCVAWKAVPGRHFQCH